MFGNKKRKIPISKDDIKQAIKNANNRLKSENSKIESNIKNSKSSLKDIESQIKSAEDVLKGFKTQASNVKSSIRMNAVKLDETSRELSDAFNKISELDASKDALQSNIDKLKDEESKLSKSLSLMNKDLSKKDDLKESIKSLKKEVSESKKELKVMQNEIGLYKSDSVAALSSKNSLEAEFKAYKISVDKERKELQLDIEMLSALKSEKQRKHDDVINQLDKEIDDRKDESEMYTGLMEKAKQDYISIQANIIASEKKLSMLEEKIKDTTNRQELFIKRIKERYEAWKINELDKIAKLKIKGKIDNIDKAGLKEILDV